MFGIFLHILTTAEDSSGFHHILGTVEGSVCFPPIASNDPVLATVPLLARSNVLQLEHFIIIGKNSYRK